MGRPIVEESRIGSQERRGGVLGHPLVRSLGTYTACLTTISYLRPHPVGFRNSGRDHFNFT
nr:MAG: hypothetical protein AM324_01855 [Candidatus Thorarchaeota archaeon SMTZ1-83]